LWGFGSDEQPHNVFVAMRNILTLVLEESEKIPADMLEVILKSLLKTNKVGLSGIVLSGLFISSPDGVCVTQMGLRLDFNQTIFPQIIILWQLCKA